MHPSRLASAFALAVPLLACGPVRAQCMQPEGAAVPCDAGGSRVRGTVETAAVNAVLGGVTAGVLRRVHGGRFAGAFVRGAAGGALTYAGKRVVVQRFYGAGLLGRQVASAGASVSYNAAAGAPALSRIVLPVGPARVYLRPGSASPVRVRWDVATLGVIAYAALQPNDRFDLSESVSAGAVVFRRYVSAGQVPWEGVQVAGVVQIRHAPYERRDGAAVGQDVRGFLAGVTAHERVHVLQYDQSFLLWSAPAEDAVLDRSRIGRALHRNFDLGIGVALWASMNAAIPSDDRPWEREAYFISRTFPEQIGGRPDGL